MKSKYGCPQCGGHTWKAMVVYDDGYAEEDMEGLAIVDHTSDVYDKAFVNMARTACLTWQYVDLCVACGVTVTF